MDPLYYWRRTWDRVLIRPEDLRSFQRQLASGVDTAFDGQKMWEMFPWQDRFYAAGAGSVEAQIHELPARHKSMISLEIRIARTPEDMTLADVLDLPTQEPIAPRARSVWEVNGPPVSTHLLIKRTHPAVELEIRTVSRLAGGSILSRVTPHIEKTVRRAPSSDRIGFVALLVGCALADGFLALGTIGPALALVLVFFLGAGGFFAAVATMDWLFPSFELLPDDHSRSRWERAWLVTRTMGAAIVGAIGVIGFLLALNQ